MKISVSWLETLDYIWKPNEILQLLVRNMLNPNEKATKELGAKLSN